MPVVEDRLAAMGLVLPELRQPIGIYQSAARVGDLLFLSGHGPIRDGERVLLGKVGTDLSIEQGQDAARLCIINALRTVKEYVGNLDSIERVVKLLGFVNSAPAFKDQPMVIDAASQMLVEALGERGWHARSAVGVYELPFGISVEIEMLLQIRPS